MSYQYNVEVVNAIPLDVLSDDASKNKITLRCVRRDATFDCTAVPASFEVRNAPGYDLLECALVSRNDDSDIVMAHSFSPLVIGGPHRTVGAVWVPMKAVSMPTSPLLDDAKGSTQPSARVFIAWTMANMDGSPLCTSMLEVPPPSITNEINSATAVASTAVAEGREVGCDFATPCASVETSPLGMVDVVAKEHGTGGIVTPASVLTSSHRASTATGYQDGGGDTLADSHGGKSDSAGLMAHVSIVQDEAQEAAQLGDSERSFPSGGGSAAAPARHTASEVPSMLQSAVVDGHSGLRSGKEEAQSFILAQFPKCSVSSSPVFVASEEGDEGTTAAAKSADAAKEDNTVVKGVKSASSPAAADNSSFPPVFVNYYSSSTQSVKGISFEHRHRNLYLVPCPLLLDQLKADVLPTSTPGADGTASSAKMQHLGGNELWRVSHRYGTAGAPLGSATSAVEAIRIEHEARQRSFNASSTGPKYINANSSSNGAADGEDPVADRRVSSTLPLLRQRAMAAISQRRVTYDK